MTYINLMLAWDMMAGLDGLKLKSNSVICPLKVEIREDPLPHSIL